MASSADGYSLALRLIEFINIPKKSGDVIVLLLHHPGFNLLGRYLPPSKINDLLLAEAHQGPPHEDMYMVDAEDPELTEDSEVSDIMDLASFLE